MLGEWPQLGAVAPASVDIKKGGMVGYWSTVRAGVLKGAPVTGSVVKRECEATARSKQESKWC